VCCLADQVVIMASHLMLNLNRLSQRAILLHNIKSPLVLASNEYHGRGKIGKREVVGFGMNGEYSYIDALDHPCPAIRFKEDTPEIAKLREKEKGDWKKLSMEDKKARKWLCALRTIPSLCECPHESLHPSITLISTFTWTLFTLPLHLTEHEFVKWMC